MLEKCRLREEVVNRLRAHAAARDNDGEEKISLGENCAHPSVDNIFMLEIARSVVAREISLLYGCVPFFFLLVLCVCAAGRESSRVCEYNAERIQKKEGG